jgi:hypothetical protein
MTWACRKIGCACRVKQLLEAKAAGGTKKKQKPRLRWMNAESHSMNMAVRRWRTRGLDNRMGNGREET